MIRVQGLSKRFKVYPKPVGRLVEWATLNRAVRHTDFWALRGLDLHVRRGECVGVIGPNGAGKSTLLKILTGTLTASSGAHQVTGRVLSLLELGTGFSAELTGRRNVVETAGLLGFPGGYVRERMADIAGFADIGDFFDRPIKTYSTGMTVRLAFAMFAFLRPDVLIVDEALAVGDVGFQRRCYKKIEELLSAGTTCLMVTHDLPAVVQFCHRAVVLQAGVKTFEGDPRQAVNRLNDLYFGIAAPASAEERSGDGNATVGELWFENPAGERIGSTAAMKTVVFCYAVRFAIGVDAVDFGFHVKTLLGAEVTTAGSEKLGHRFGPMRAGQTVVVRWRLELTLNPGSYFFGCGVRYHQSDRFLDRRVDAVKFPVADLSVVGGLVNPVRGVSVEMDPPPSAPAGFETAGAIGGSTRGVP